MRYDLHGFIEIVLDTASKAYERYFENEYRRIGDRSGAKRPAPVRVTVHVRSSLPTAMVGDICRTVRFKRLFRFEYLVRGLHTDDVHLHFRRHAIDRAYVTAVGVFLQAQVLEPILYLKLLEQGALLMHTAAVCDERYGYLFPAHGGTGKTTLSLNLVRRGFRLLGDDLVLVDPSNCMVYPYPRPLHLFSYNLHQMRGTPLPWRLRTAIHMKDVIRLGLEAALREEFLISTRAHVDEVLPGTEFGPAVQYRKLTFLTTARSPQVLELDGESVREQVARIIVESADLNVSLYSNVLAGDEDAISGTKAKELAVMISVLRPLRSVEFVNPRLLDADAFDRFAARIRS